jgi:Nucleotidyl transferase AbiEii toxin, Type IV TA system
VNAPKSQSDWARLFRVATSLIKQVNSEASVIDRWTFGGGTAMMLQIDHRESHDVDIFLEDPQFLPFLDPQKRDFKFEILPTDYGGDGTSSLKLVFNEIGEIDFIVDHPKTAEPTIERLVEGQLTLLETIPEIITKKIVHRGSSIKPRDIFDIAAAAENYSDAVTTALRSYRADVLKTIEALDRLNPKFVTAAIVELIIRDKYQDIAKTALDRTRQILRSV